jgi:transitional endoplasmic reticulum ATPase
MQSRSIYQGYLLHLDPYMAKVFIAALVALACVIAFAVADASMAKRSLSWWDGSAPDTHWFRAFVGKWWLFAALAGVINARFALLLPVALVGLGIAAATNNSATAWIWWGLAFLSLVVPGWWLQFHEWLGTPRQTASAKQSAASGQRTEVIQGPRVRRPERDFRSIIGMSAEKARLIEAGRAAVAKSAKSNGILLYGEPGNGKTAFAEALAGELQLKWISISTADIVSRWIGAGPEQLSAAFQQAQKQAPCVLFIDEADSVFASRELDGLHQDQINLTNVFLTEAVRVRGKGVLIIAATNSLERLDGAAIREGRFDHKIEIGAPDLEARVGLLREGLRQHAPGARVEDDVLNSVARRWSGFSASRLIAVTRQAGTHANAVPSRRLGFDDLMACMRSVQGTRIRVSEQAKSLDELVLGPAQRRALQSLVVQMKNSFQTERLGGSLPTGVLFWGAPGTGKTEAVRALAKDTGWALVAAAGHDLLAKPDLADKLFRDARDARPSIVFIDEAEDVLGHRQLGGVAAVTNKLLTLMDGVGGRVPDLLFIAATNSPAALDPAVLRGGRFAEKIEFTAPELEAITEYAMRWLGERGWAIDDEGIAALGELDGQPIANVTAVLQAAVNQAITDAKVSGNPHSRTVGSDAVGAAISRNSDSWAE